MMTVAQMLHVEKALETIRRGLVVGKWEPGEQISLESVAEELGISRTPVRDAFNELVVQGILERRPGIGTRVPQPTLHRLGKLWDLRAVLEGLAARWLAEEASDAAIAALTVEAKEADELQSSMSEQLLDMAGATQEEDLRYRLYEAHDQFHRDLVEYAGNADLLSAWQPCHFLLLLGRSGPSASALYRRPVEVPHRRIMAAISSRDADLAEQAMHEHIQEAKETLMGSLSTQSDTAFAREAERAVAPEGR